MSVSHPSVHKARLWTNDRITDVERTIGRLIASYTSDGRPDTAQFRLDVLALQALSKGRVPYLLDALKEMKAHGETDLQSFEKRHAEVAARAQDTVRSPSAEWTILIPFNIRLASAIPNDAEVTALGRTFQFRTWSTVFQNVDKAKINWAISRLTGAIQPTYTDTCVAVTGRGQDFHTAWTDIEPAFDTLRGLLELTLGLGSTICAVPQRPRRRIPCPLWAVGYAVGQEPEGLTFYVYEEDKKERAFELTAETFAILCKNAGIVGRTRVERSLESLLADCLRLYSQAMDARLNHECFLGLWQLAEAITLGERHCGNRTKICGRLAWFGRNWKNFDESCLRDALEWLYEKRNKVVHRGLHRDVDYEDVNFLKICCDGALKWLGGQAGKLETINDLEHFYNLVGQAHEYRESLQRVLNYISTIVASNSGTGAGAND